MKAAYRMGNQSVKGAQPFAVGCAETWQRCRNELQKWIAIKIGRDAESRADARADHRAVVRAEIYAGLVQIHFAEVDADSGAAPAGRPVYRGQCTNLFRSSSGATYSSCLQVAPLEL